LSLPNYQITNYFSIVFRTPYPGWYLSDEEITEFYFIEMIDCFSLITLGMGAADVMKKVRDGYRLEKPEHTSREIYNYMVSDNNFANELSSFV
jgi:hypothetical protein